MNGDVVESGPPTLVDYSRSAQYYLKVSTRSDRRVELQLSQTAAAAKAGVSLATWRRWEEDPDSVSAQTRQSCGRVLAEDLHISPALSEVVDAFERAWGDNPSLTPRQAYAIAMTLDMWSDGELDNWVNDPREPLYEVGPFAHFDRRVLFFVDGNRAWVETVRDRCYSISEEIQNGILPFSRHGAFIDEVLVAAALIEAKEYLTEMPEIFEPIKPRMGQESGDTYDVGDDDWDLVSDWFDDICQWDEWEVPVMSGHPLLRAVLDARHPYTWFDRVPASGAGYLQRLQGLVLEDEER